MNVRDHYTPSKAPDWSRPGNSFKPLTERGAEPVSIAWRHEGELRASERAKLAATTPDHPAASIEAWRSSPFVARELDRAKRIGFGWGCAITVLLALILWFALGVRP